jgi:hypothetical protein
MSGSLSLFAEHYNTLYVLLTLPVIIELTRDKRDGLALDRKDKKGRKLEVVKGLTRYSFLKTNLRTFSCIMNYWTIRESVPFSRIFPKLGICAGFSLNTINGQCARARSAAITH